MENYSTIVTMRTPASITEFKRFIDYTRNLIKEKNPIALEIGSFAGDSTRILCQNYSQVIAIDPWQDIDHVYQRFSGNTKCFNNVTVYRNYSYEIHDKFNNESIDFLYIDGSHEYEDVKQDCILYIPKVKRGGIIAGHDYRRNKFPGVIKAVNELLGKPEMVFKEHSWYFIKK